MLVLVLADIIAFAVLPLSLLYPDSFTGQERRLDAAAVLFNDFNGHYTGINRETERRLNAGLELLHSNRIDQLILAGGNRQEMGLSGARMMAGYLAELQVPVEKILIEDRSRDSLSNLARIQDLARKHNIRRIGLISSPYHLKRLKTMAGAGSAGFTFLPYDPLQCRPPLSRKEAWVSAHYNLAAYLLHILLPRQAYESVVLWVRENTDW